MAASMEDDTGTQKNALNDDLSLNTAQYDKNVIREKLDENSVKLLDLRTKMLERISDSDAHFKHQQRGEPDLTKAEKCEIAKNILENNKVTFLKRFGKYLTKEDLECFIPFTSDYMTNYYVNDIRKHLDGKRNVKEVRNRRYEAMKEMVSKGTYFSETEMKARDPLLYEQMIGQYLTPEEAEEMAASYVDKSDCRFSSILLGFIDNKQESALHDLQKEREDDQEEEEDEDSDSEDNTEKDEFQPSEGEKLQLRNEFMQIMQERFLEGNDKDFNYTDVDSNAHYDSLDIREHDEEEKYFDDEQPETVFMETDHSSGHS